MSNFSNHNFKGEKALIRVDFNVPVDDSFRIMDDTRMRSAVPSVKKVLNDGGSVILMSHFGRPKDGPSEKYSLKHLLPHLQELLEPAKVLFANDCIGQDAITKSKNLKPGEVLLLENLRFYKEEEKGDENFAQKLSKLGDVYVNDAFGTAHRAHASTAIVAKYFPAEKKMFGLLMEIEVSSAEKVLHDTSKPFTAILGGAKVGDKILIIENLLHKANNIIIGGGMAYTFLKAQGKETGSSMCETDKLDLAREILAKAKEKNVVIYLPVDSVVADKFASDANTKVVSNDHIEDGWMGLDIGSEAIKYFRNVILESKTILWNGPMGVFEMQKFQAGTKAVAEAVADATIGGAFSLIGGGDSVSAINQFHLADKVSFVSTGGGALLEYFEGKTLPGIAAILNS
ncbi:MAG: phosphoglycerate kinase [Ginsengibacter sp.]